ncbi:rhomboid family intramembrane serine protease [Enterococcus timonensis]|uniref:rhomboid family intramembrane serine protease n=1 Tax=Enterococcus timonensis TaxID=1852364 RepID=UPI0008D91254|nr:rhomboid family intramembrane serine protease [Enterococcus timonensis]
MNKTRFSRNFSARPFVMYGLLLFQTVMMLWMEIDGLGYGGSENISVLLRFGAMERGSIIINHEYWRFIMPMFLHIGWAHFAINSVTLYFIGQQVETVYGHWRFLVIYLLSGIAGNVLSFALGQPNTISAGASTALFGMFGAFVILGRIYRNNPAVKMLVQRYLTFIVMNLIFNLFSSSVDMMGHIGGLLGGVLVSLAVAVPVKGKVNIHERIVAGILFVALIGILFIYGFKKYGFSL